MSEVNVTRHADKRIRKRNGLPRSAVEKNAANALVYGITRTESNGALHRYMDALWHKYRNGDNARVYNGSVYIFDSETLITVFPLPPKYRKTAENQKKERKEDA